MGMLLFPVFFGALIIFVTVLIKMISLIKGNELTLSIIVLGVLLPIVVVACTSIYWAQKGKLPHIAPLFMLPFLLIYLPAILYLVLKLILPVETIPIIRSAIFVSIFTSGVIMYPLITHLPTLLVKMGVKLYY